MAINVPNNVISPIADDMQWDGKSGLQVEEFIKRKLNNAIVDIDHTPGEENIQFIKEDGTRIEVSMVSGSYEYTYDFNITNIEFTPAENINNNNEFTIEKNSIQSAKIKYTFGVKSSFGGQLPTTWEGQKKITIGFDTDGDENIIAEREYAIYTTEDGEQKELDILSFIKTLPVSSIPKLIRYKIEDQAWVNTYNKIKVMQLSISPISNQVVTSNQFNITVPSGDKVLYYVSKLTGSNNTVTYKTANVNKQTATITLRDTESTDTEIYAVSIRATSNFTDSNIGPELFSDWYNYNIIYQPNNGHTGDITISNIANQILDCNGNVLFNVIPTNKLTTNAVVHVYKSANPDTLFHIDSSNYKSEQSLQNRIRIIKINRTNDLETEVFTLTMFVEGVTESEFYLKFIIENTDTDTAYVFKSLLPDNVRKPSTPSLSSQFYVKVNRVIGYDKQLYHTEDGVILDFSLISLNSVFNDVTTADQSDGLQYNDLISFKASPSSGKIFSGKGLKLSGQQINSNLIQNNLDFSIELMFKTSNIASQTQPIFSIGDYNFYPQFARIENNAEELTGGVDDIHQLYYISQIDYQQEQMTHVLITYCHNYCPSTYDYAKIYGKWDQSTADKFDCIKVYINGVINRVIPKSASILIYDTNRGSYFQINPTDATVDFYIFRTYYKCLSYEEVMKNYISSLTKFSDKVDYYRNNSIIFNEDDYRYDDPLLSEKLKLNGTISLNKCMGRVPYTSGATNRYWNKKNILLFVLDDVTQTLENKSVTPLVAPLNYNNKTNKRPQASILIRYAGYAGESYDKEYSGLIAPKKRIKDGELVEYFKAQGSSAKKYGGAYNTQFSKFKYTSQQAHEENGETVEYYKMPNDDNIQVTKLVGKVNIASSLQAHKMMACKLYNDAYKAIYEPTKVERKAVYEEPFMYFYILLSDIKNAIRNDIELEDVSWDDITTEVANKAKFYGFLTWGSAKADSKSFGIDDNTIIFEGADNQNACANFKVPWTAQQMWNPDETINKEYYSLFGNDGPKQNVIKQYTGKTKEGKIDYITGLYIWDETIKYKYPMDKESADTDFFSPDSWDVSGKCLAEGENKYYSISDTGKKLISHFAEFYNGVYTYDAASLQMISNTTKGFIANGSNNYSMTQDVDTSKKYVAPYAITIDGKNYIQGDIIRYDPINKIWVNAGLFYHNDGWDTLNIKTLYNELINAINGEANFLYKDAFKREYFTQFAGWSKFGENFDESFANENRFKEVKQILLLMFKCIIEKYLNTNDICFHQAFMRYILGTDNRAKNTYYKIKLVENPETHETEIVIEMFQDDLDTILKTDNNGQLTKSYNLLEPTFNILTKERWGDNFSALFVNVDLAFQDEINTSLNELLTYVKNNDFINLYFNSAANYFPAISYNHTSEIYYETVLTIFKKTGDMTQGSLTAFGNSLGAPWDKFTNNQVPDPVSLSHGSCKEAEMLFFNNRNTFLGTLVNNPIGYSNDYKISLKSASGEGVTGGNITLDVDATYNVDNYPSILGTGIYEKLNNIISIECNYLSPLSEVSYLANNTDVIDKIAIEPVQDTYYKLYGTVDSSVSLTGGTGTLYNTHLISKIKFNDGYQYLSGINFPNAKQIEINCKNTNELYLGEPSSIFDMSKSLGSAKIITLKNVELRGSYVDFRNCNALEELDLDGCKLKKLVLPQSNKLYRVIIPSEVEDLTFGYYPDLDTFNLAIRGNNIKRLTIDANNSKEIIHTFLQTCRSIEYIEFLNVPESGLHLDAIDIDTLCNISDFNNIVFIGKSNKIHIDNDLSFARKIHMLQTWGNSIVADRFVYTERATRLVTVNQETTIPNTSEIHMPNYGILCYSGTTINSETSNDMLLSDIQYQVVSTSNTLLNKSSINTSTGEITLTSNAEGEIQVRVTIKGIQSSTVCKIHVGTRNPKQYDYVYSDGSYSDIYYPTKTLAGWVYYAVGNIAYIMAANRATDVAHPYYLETYNPEDYSLSRLIYDAVVNKDINKTLWQDLCTPGGNIVIAETITGNFIPTTFTNNLNLTTENNTKIADFLTQNMSDLGIDENSETKYGVNIKPCLYPLYRKAEKYSETQGYTGLLQDVKWMIPSVRDFSYIIWLLLNNLDSSTDRDTGGGYSKATYQDGSSFAKMANETKNKLEFICSPDSRNNIMSSDYNNNLALFYCATWYGSSPYRWMTMQLYSSLPIDTATNCNTFFVCKVEYN